MLDTLQTFDPGNGNRLVQTVNGGATLTLTGGTMQGTIDARDGTLATLQTGINALASTLITNVNNVNDNGYNLTGTGGNAFFDGSDASSITVNPTMVNNPSMIPASGSATATGDNTVALQMAHLADLAHIRAEQPDFRRCLHPECGGVGRCLANGKHPGGEPDFVGEQHVGDPAQFRQRRERGRGDDQPDDFPEGIPGISRPGEHGESDDAISPANGDLIDYANRHECIYRYDARAIQRAGGTDAPIAE